MRLLKVILPIALASLGCNLPDYFAEYSDNNGDPINLIEGFELPPDSATPDYNRNSRTKIVVVNSENVEIPDPATWDISYGDDSLVYNYLVFGNTDATVTGVSGIPDGSPVFSLEVADLAPAAMLNSGSWDQTEITIGTLSGAGSLIADMESIDYATFPINASIADSPGTYPATYSTAVHLATYTRFRPYVPGTSWPVYDSGGTDETIYLSDFVNQGGLDFYIGAPPGYSQYPNDCTIDEIHMARTDIEYNLELYIPEFAEGRPPIIDGKYRFSIWIRQDSDGLTSDVESLTLGITSYNTNNAYFKSYNVSDTSGGQPVYPGGWANWTRIDLVTTIGDSVQLNQNNPSDYPAVVLTISPRYMNKMLGGESTIPGVLLFASPSLCFLTE